MFLLQGMVRSLERSLSAVTEELADVSAKSETLQGKVGSIPLLNQQLQVRTVRPPFNTSNVIPSSVCAYSH